MNMNMNININDLLPAFNNDEPGVSILVGNKEKILYTQNVGLANLEHNIPLKENSIFNIASISKPITAIGIMHLIEQGVIDLDEEFVKYLPDFQSSFNNIKIRQLLNHTSGIKNYYDILRESNQKSSDFSNKDFISLMQKHNALDFLPGEKFEYSNSNYVFLSLIIEAINKSTFYDYMKSTLFSPMEMDDTYVYTENKPIIPNLAYGYSYNNGTYYCDYTSTLTLGDGCVLSTPRDLYKLLVGMISGNVLHKSTWDLMKSSSKTSNGDTISYGLGWETGYDKAARIVYHSGLDAGYRNLLTFYPEKELIIILLSNNSRFSYANRKEITHKIAELI